MTGIVENLQTLAAPLDELHLLEGNPRVGDVDAVAASLARFGQRKPIVARTDGTVIAGNHTLQAARQLGWTHIAVVRVDDDDATAKAFALADNRTAELGGYDDVALEAMVRDVLEFDAELLADTGWAGEDLEALLASVDIEELPPVEADPDAVPAVPTDPVTNRGDVWLLGPHRLICGDCRDFADIERLMAGNAANVVFTSPPYAEQREYDQSSGFRPIKPDEYVDWWEDLQANVRSVLAADGSFFVNIRAHAIDGQRHLYVHDLVAAHVRRWGWLFVDDLCWVDTKNGVPGGWPNRFKDAWEPVYHFATNRQIKFRPFANATESGDV
ncbi:DNA methyltransferase, partial [Polynucleobacter sp.]|uniref:DNA methyltransferase n=1 Tax=Polynucleobacter sp. TaxID=2029855 RepID=UPI003F69EAD6